MLLEIRPFERSSVGALFRRICGIWDSLFLLSSTRNPSIRAILGYVCREKQFKHICNSKIGPCPSTRTRSIQRLMKDIHVRDNQPRMESDLGRLRKQSRMLDTSLLIARLKCCIKQRTDISPPNEHWSQSVKPGWIGSDDGDKL